MQVLQNHRTFFNCGATRPIAYRRGQLELLKKTILAREQKIYEALFTDLRKCKESTWITEIGMVINEINYAIKNIDSWTKPTSAGTNLLNFPSKSYTIPEPLGVVLIIAPWNYPFQLLFNPLIGAIAAGNCVAVKGSEFAKATDAVMKEIVEDCFEREYISYHSGDGAEVFNALTSDFRFDHIFYTGSTAIGKLIYQRAAETLTPVTLELGGKSPCIVDDTANLKVAAKRIAVTKYDNSGQMCVAPDYLLVHKNVSEEFVMTLKQTLTSFYGEDASASYDYGRIINERQFNRLASYLQDADIVFGGSTNASDLYIEPTIIRNCKHTDAVMQDEIFGPILPYFIYETNEEALAIIEKHKNPLAFYIYSNSKTNQAFFTNNVSFGGGCINNSSWHLTNHNLPFGGRGNSGMGNYHGKYSFKTFSHTKAIMKTPTWFNPSIKFPSFKGKLNLFKKI
jgi:aldehyde dehydrogenase (NAD+)